MTAKNQLIRKLRNEHGIDIEWDKLHSLRSKGFGSPVISWTTINQKQNYQSFDTMKTCIKYPTKLIKQKNDSIITVEINLSISDLKELKKEYDYEIPQFEGTREALNNLRI